MLMMLIAAEASCLDAVRADPVRAAQIANAWHLKGGGVLARQCLAFAYLAQQRWPSAATAFEQAAREAEGARDDAVAVNLWVQAGNARLAGGEYAAARLALDKALSSPDLAGMARGEARLDRARANVGLDALTEARADLDEALKLAPDDPLAWLLSATLARRMGDLDRARADIATAGSRAPDDAMVALEAGQIALAAGAPAAARLAFEAAIKVQPNSEAAGMAQAALDRLPPQGQPEAP
jgi:tetratricopeptide (TPR) repeat protein